MSSVFVALFAFPLVLAVGAAVLLLGGTNAPDDLRKHPAALYHAFLTLTGVLLLLFATFLTATGCVYGHLAHAVVGVITGGVGVALLGLSAEKVTGATGATVRIAARLVYTVSAIALLTGLAAAAAAAYAIFGLVAPHSAGFSGTTGATRALVAAGAVAAVAAYVLRRAWASGVRAGTAAPAVE